MGDILNFPCPAPKHWSRLYTRKRPSHPHDFVLIEELRPKDFLASIPNVYQTQTPKELSKALDDIMAIKEVEDMIWPKQ